MTTLRDAILGGWHLESFETRDDSATVRRRLGTRLQSRWGGLLSYRYIGRSYDSMDLGPTDNTVTVRRDMRDNAGGLLMAVPGLAAPRGRRHVGSGSGPQSGGAQLPDFRSR